MERVMVREREREGEKGAVSGERGRRTRKLPVSASCEAAAFGR